MKFERCLDSEVNLTEYLFYNSIKCKGDGILRLEWGLLKDCFHALRQIRRTPLTSRPLLQAKVRIWIWNWHLTFLSTEFQYLVETWPIIKLVLTSTWWEVEVKCTGSIWSREGMTTLWTSLVSTYISQISEQPWHWSPLNQLPSSESWAWASVWWNSWWQGHMLGP